MPADHHKVATPKPARTNHKSIFGRSQITNGKRLLPGVHKGSQWARRFYDVVHLYASDQGGDDNLSEGRRSLIRRIACLQVELELLETKFALAGGAEAGESTGARPWPDHHQLHGLRINGLLVTPAGFEPATLRLGI
jgi:hypothetical protein